MKTVRWFALVAAATAATSMLFSPTAFATPPVGAESVVISQSTVDGIDYITRDIIIQPGGSTGWHYHDGRTFGVVREGTLTRTMEDC
jgi:quercetin dioxygenase-like cupin family protein